MDELEQLRQAAARYRGADESMKNARDEVRAAVRAALAAGFSITEVTAASPYSDREQIRRIRG